MPHGRYLQLPYKGYLREIFVSLAGASPSARFGFFHAAGDLQDDGPDNLFKVRTPPRRFLSIGAGHVSCLTLANKALRP